MQCLVAGDPTSQRDPRYIDGVVLISFFARGAWRGEVLEGDAPDNRDPLIFAAAEDFGSTVSVLRTLRFHSTAFERNSNILCCHARLGAHYILMVPTNNMGPFRFQVASCMRARHQSRIMTLYTGSRCVGLWLNASSPTVVILLCERVCVCVLPLNSPHLHPHRHRHPGLSDARK